MGANQLKERIKLGVNVMVLSFLALLVAVGIGGDGVIPVAIFSTFATTVAIFSILNTLKKYSAAEEK